MCGSRMNPFAAFLRLPLSVSLVCLLILFAQQSHALGLIDIYQLAQKNDPAFQVAHLQKMISKEKRRQAIAYLLPTVAASAEQMQTSQDIKSSDNTVFGAGSTDFDTTTYGVTLTQPIFRWDSIVGLKQSKFETMRAEAEYALAAQDLIIRVTALYLQALAAQDQLAFAMAEKVAIEKFYEVASARHEMGLIPITDMHDAKARMATTQARAIEAQDMVDDAMQSLQEVTGEPIDTLNRLQAEIDLASPEPLDIESWVAGALEQNPAIELQKRVVEVARQEVRKQRAGHYPSLDLLGRYNSEETEGTLFGGGSEVTSTDILLQLNIPLYQGGYISSRVREAKLQLSIAEQQLTQQLRSIKRQTRSSFLGVNSALKRVDALNQSVVANQLAREAKLEGFRSGIYTSLAVLDAERDLFLVKQDYAQARYDYLLDSMRLKQTSGSLSAKDLSQLNEWFTE